MRRSHGLYLWHWPVVCFTRPGVDLPVPGFVAFVLRMALTFLLAAVSYRWIESDESGPHAFVRSAHV